MATGLADCTGFEILDEDLAQDLERRIADALSSGAVFGEARTPLAVFRQALRSSIRSIEEHPRGLLFQRFLKDGPYEGDGDVPAELSTQRLSDKETASAITFIHSHMVNAFQGCLAELLAAGSCANLVKNWKAAGLVPPDTRLYVGDTVRIGVEPRVAGAKGADMHLLVVRNGIVDVVGVIEVKSYSCSRTRLRFQTMRHLARVAAGLRIDTTTYLPSQVRTSVGAPGLPVRISVVPSSWTLPTTFRFERNDKGRTLHIDPPVLPASDDHVFQMHEDEWSVVLRWSHEALAAAAFEMTFWYMEKVGEVIFAGGVPAVWAEMSPAEAGRNATKMMLYYAILRAETWRQEQRAIALYNTYGFGYALGMNFRKKDGKREMLWPEDLDEIAANGVNKDGCTIAGAAPESSREPLHIRRGKEFHTSVQAEWMQEAKGTVSVEEGIEKPSGRRGRIDVLVDGGEGLTAVVEIEGSDWDRMTEMGVRRNVASHVSQIWDYIESQLANGKVVSPGVVFPRRPKSQRRLDLIESLFQERGIAVVWQDESIESRSLRVHGTGEKDRNEAEKP